MVLKQPSVGLADEEAESKIFTKPDISLVIGWVAGHCQRYYETKSHPVLAEDRAEGRCYSKQEE